jgi:hypothetical protein
MACVCSVGLSVIVAIFMILFRACQACCCQTELDKARLVIYSRCIDSFICNLNVTCAHISVSAPQAGNKGASRVAILERQKQDLEEKTVQMGEYHQQLRATEAELEQARYIFTILWTFKTIRLLLLQRCTRTLLFFIQAGGPGPGDCCCTTKTIRHDEARACKTSKRGKCVY